MQSTNEKYNMSLTRNESIKTFFGGAALGLAGYAATYYVSPAIIGAANFAAANFFAGFLGTTAGAMVGIASIAVAAAVISGLIALALFAAYKWFTNKPAQKNEALTDNRTVNSNTAATADTNIPEPSVIPGLGSSS